MNPALHKKCSHIRFKSLPSSTQKTEEAIQALLWKYHVCVLAKRSKNQEEQSFTEEQGTS